MGSYHHVMPGNGLVLSAEDSLGCMNGEMDQTQCQEKKDDFICVSLNQKRTAEGDKHSLPGVASMSAGNQHNRVTRAVKNLHHFRSVSESECDHLPLPNLNWKDLETGEKSPTANTDVEQQTDDLDGLLFPDEVKLPVPPDGGWGWVIVTVSFVCCAVVDGLCSVFGVLLPELVIYFEESSSKVSLAGSVLAGGFLLSGPVASVVINCLGCRWATMIGAILSAVAMITSTWSTSVITFILLFGALGGLGIGLIYLPASVMVGYYFERRRGLAAGISSSGAGVGMLILSLLAAFLMVQYGWKGCLIIMAGVCLQCLICGSLMRPLVPTIIVVKAEAFLGEEINKDASKIESILTGFTPNLEVIKENVPLASPVLSELPSSPALPHSTSQNNTDSTKSVNSYAGESSTSVEKQNGTESRRISGVGSCVELDLKRESISSSRTLTTPNRQQVSQERKCSDGIDYYSCHELSSQRNGGSIIGLRTKRSSSVLSETVVVTPLMKKDIFYSGSLASLQNSLSRADKDVGSAVLSIPQLYHPACFAEKSIWSRALHMLKEMMDVSILFNASFLVICFANALIQLAYFVPIVFLPAYGLSLGLSAPQAAMLLAVAGLSTMLGRASAGALASLRCVNGLHLNCLSLIGAGVSTIFVIFCTSFELLVAYGFIFGLSVSGFVPMTTIFLVKYVGLNKLTNSFGLLSMIKGIFTMAGPPIAGALLDLTNSYKSTFYFAGILFISAGLLFYILPLTRKPVLPAKEYAPFYCMGEDNEETRSTGSDYSEKGKIA